MAQTELQGLHIKYAFCSVMVLVNMLSDNGSFCFIKEPKWVLTASYAVLLSEGRLANLEELRQHYTWQLAIKIDIHTSTLQNRLAVMWSKLLSPIFRRSQPETIPFHYAYLVTWPQPCFLKIHLTLFKPIARPKFRQPNYSHKIHCNVLNEESTQATQRPVTALC